MTTSKKNPVVADVTRPPYYMAGGIEVIDVVEQFGLGFHLGNVVKYVLRASKKGGRADLEKASWYLARAIARWKEVK